MICIMQQSRPIGSNIKTLSSGKNDRKTKILLIFRSYLKTQFHCSFFSHQWVKLGT